MQQCPALAETMDPMLPEPSYWPREEHPAGPPEYEENLFGRLSANVQMPRLCGSIVGVIVPQCPTFLPKQPPGFPPRAESSFIWAIALVCHYSV